MGVDKFGRQRGEKRSARGEQGQPGLGFKLTTEGDYDLQLKRLRNVARPLLDDDGATKEYTDSSISRINNILTEHRNHFDSELTSFRLEMGDRLETLKKYIDTNSRNLEESLITKVSESFNNSVVVIPSET